MKMKIIKQSHNVAHNLSTYRGRCSLDFDNGSVPIDPYVTLWIIVSQEHELCIEKDENNKYKSICE